MKGPKLRKSHDAIRDSALTDERSALGLLRAHLKEEHDLTDEQISDFLGVEEKPEKHFIPVSAFDNEELSVLETLCRFLKENVGLKNSEIAGLIFRNDRTIWTTLNNSRKKRAAPLLIKDTPYAVPVSIFRDRSLGALEALTRYLKESYNLTYHQIAVMLHRDDRTIWTAYNKKRR